MYRTLHFPAKIHVRECLLRPAIQTYFWSHVARCQEEIIQELIIFSSSILSCTTHRSFQRDATVPTRHRIQAHFRMKMLLSFPITVDIRSPMQIAGLAQNLRCVPITVNKGSVTFSGEITSDRCAAQERFILTTQSSVGSASIISVKRRFPAQRRSPKQYLQSNDCSSDEIILQFDGIQGSH
ncbi:hypothetical protein H2248_002820 [Termitomyces sp. 'cryptogamus']|nr:hypothetical protein H2248_002820 [Termitomyces sp. 'cryptogamus']